MFHVLSQIQNLDLKKLMTKYKMDSAWGWKPAGGWKERVKAGWIWQKYSMHMYERKMKLF
jgi:hypothetical protein